MNGVHAGVCLKSGDLLESFFVATAVDDAMNGTREWHGKSGLCACSGQQRFEEVFAR